MNYGRMLQQHKDSGAGRHARCPPHHTRRSFPLRAPSKSPATRRRVKQASVEKPKSTDLRSPFNPEMVDASIDIYIFNTDILLPELIKDAEDPELQARLRPRHPAQTARLQASKCTPTTSSTRTSSAPSTGSDVGTPSEAYFDANMDVAGITPIFNLYDKSWPDAHPALYQYPAPPSSSSAKPSRTGMAINSICLRRAPFVSGSVVRNSVLFPGRARQLLQSRGRRLQHHLFPRQRRPTTAASASAIIRPRRPHPLTAPVCASATTPTRTAANYFVPEVRPPPSSPQDLLRLREPRQPRIPSSRATASLEPG